MGVLTASRARQSAHGYDTRGEHWTTRAACAQPGVDPNLFTFAERDAHSRRERITRARKALAICRDCPVIQQCRRDIPTGGDRPRGVIQGGHVFDDAGRPAPSCEVCRRPIVTGYINTKYCESHGWYAGRVTQP